MSDFVNYNKRKVTLPQGFKNLNDLLQAKTLPKYSGGPSDSFDYDPSKLVTTTNSHAGKLLDIGGFVDRMKCSKAVSVCLSIRTPNHQFVIFVNSFRLKGKTSPDFVSATPIIEPEKSYEELLRTFLTKRNLKLPDMSEPFPSLFNPGIPVYPCWRINPLPADAPTLAVLITDLFREVVGLNESSELHFDIAEQFPP
jgi:hypothetical protein